MNRRRKRGPARAPISPLFSFLPNTRGFPVEGPFPRSSFKIAIIYIAASCPLWAGGRRTLSFFFLSFDFARQCG